MNTRRDLAAGLGAAALGWMAVGTAAAEPDGTRRGGARATAFPNVTLYTHEGKEVKFYDDLIRNKVVAIKRNRNLYGEGGRIYHEEAGPTIEAICRLS